jgi:hypothetical protein
VSVLTCDPSRCLNAENRTSKPRRLAKSCSSGPFTQLTTEPSYLPGPWNPARYSAAEVVNRSWQTSRPNGCSSGRVSANDYSAPLDTCIAMSPSADSSGRRISPVSEGVIW